MTIIIIDYVLPILVGQGQGSSANQKAIEEAKPLGNMYNLFGYR